MTFLVTVIIAFWILLPSSFSAMSYISYAVFIFFSQWKTIDLQRFTHRDYAKKTLIKPSLLDIVTNPGILIDIC